MDNEQEKLYMISGMVPNPLDMPKGCAFSDRCDKCMDRCRREMPSLVKQGNSQVRCFLYDQKE
jgi:peptide/nickel transport system ATP-binding protein